MTDIFVHFHSDAFSIVHTITICMSFRFLPLSNAFLDRCVFDQNAQRSSVDGRLKTHPDVCVFKRRRMVVDGVLKHELMDLPDIFS